MCHVKFKSDGHHFSWKKPITTIHNILVGSLYVDQVLKCLLFTLHCWYCYLLIPSISLPLIGWVPTVRWFFIACQGVSNLEKVSQPVAIEYLRHCTCTLFWLLNQPAYDINLLFLWFPPLPSSKLLTIQDHAQNLEEQLWTEWRREVSIIFHRCVTSSDLKQERSGFYQCLTFLQLVAVCNIYEWAIANHGELKSGRSRGLATARLFCQKKNGRKFQVLAFSFISVFSGKIEATSTARIFLMKYHPLHCTEHATGFLLSDWLYCLWHGIKSNIWHRLVIAHKLWACYIFIQNISPIWLAKSTRLIHHNQSLMTKFGRILCLTRKWRHKCSVRAG